MSWYNAQICKNGINKEGYKKFLLENDYTYTTIYNNKCCIKRLFKTGSNVTVHNQYNENPPHIENALVFKSSDNKSISLIYHPRAKSADIKNVIYNWAKKHGFKALILDPSYSWFYPGETCIVAVSLPETIVKISKII